MFSQRILAHSLICALMMALLVSSASVSAQLLRSDNEFLPPDEAFGMSVTRNGTGFVALWKIANDYYLYRDKIRIKSPRENITLHLPDGLQLKDEFFGETTVFRHFVEVPFNVKATSPDEATVSITYQGCADAGLCYPPITKQVDLSRVSFAAAQGDGAASPKNSLSLPMSEQFRVLQSLEDGSLIAIIIAFLGFGLLLAFTPCVLPMVPILSGIIANNSQRTDDLSSRKTFVLSLSYVFAMAVTYSLFGVAIGLTGEALQFWFQQPWVISLFAMVFVLLALSMFGFYELHLPAAIQTRLHAWSSHHGSKQSAIGTAAIMGALSALIVAPCTTPALIGALLFIAQTGDAVVGGAALFSLAFGMGIPLLIIGTSLGSLLPKPGAILNAVKVIFGLLMLGVAVFLLDRIVPPSIILLLSGALLMLSATCLYQIVKHGSFSIGGNVLIQGLAIVILLYGALLIIGSAMGGSSLLRPLEDFTVSSKNHNEINQHAVVFKQVGSLQDIELQIALAEQQGQAVMLDFYADWCVTCKEMEAFTFSKEKVAVALAGFTLLQVDVTENSDSNKNLLKHFGLFGPPAILFFDVNSYEIESARVVGYMNADDFVHHLEQVFSVRRI